MDTPDNARRGATSLGRTAYPDLVRYPDSAGGGGIPLTTGGQGQFMGLGNPSRTGGMGLLPISHLDFGSAKEGNGCPGMDLGTGGN